MTDTVHNPVVTEEEIKAGDVKAGDTAVSVEKGGEEGGGKAGEGVGEGEGGGEGEEEEVEEKGGKQDKEKKEEKEGKQDKEEKEEMEEKEGKQDKEEMEEKSEAKDEIKARPKGVRFDASLLPKSNDPAEIRKQVCPPPPLVRLTRLSLCQIEFYFSNSNLPFDKFLWGLVTKDNNPVPLKLVATFKRMRRFEDYATIVAAMRESDALEVAGGDGEETIRRKVPLPIGAHAHQQKEPAGDGEEPVVVRTVFDKALKTSMYAVRDSLLCTSLRPSD